MDLEGVQSRVFAHWLMRTKPTRCGFVIGSGTATPLSLGKEPPATSQYWGARVGYREHDDGTSSPLYRLPPLAFPPHRLVTLHTPSVSYCIMHDTLQVVLLILTRCVPPDLCAFFFFSFFFCRLTSPSGTIFPPLSSLFLYSPH